MKILPSIRSLTIPLVTCLLLSTASAQPQQLEPADLQTLGVTAAQLGRLKLVSEIATKVKDASPGLSLDKVYFAQAGGNRRLWRIDFADDLPVDNSNIILYLNTDNDKKTGRPDYEGVDLMIWIENGVARAGAIDAGGKTGEGPAANAVIIGKQLYVSVDADFKQEGEETPIPMRIVAQTAQPLKSQSNTPFFELRDVPVTKEAKMVRTEIFTKNENVVYTWGLADLRRMLEDSQNVPLPITEAKLAGWAIDANTEYRENSVILRGGKGSIKSTVPRAGRFYPSFILYDETPSAALAFYVNGRQQGIAVTRDGNNDQKLFALQKPLDLKQGDVVELRNLNNNGEFRIETLLLLKELFPPKANQYDVKYLEASRPWQDPAAMRFTFTTTWPTQAHVRYGTTEKLGQEIVEKTVPLNNHRLLLRGLKEGQKYFYVVTATDPQGREVRTPVKSFVYQQPSYPVAVAGTQTVPLKLAHAPQTIAWPVNSGVPLAKGKVFKSANLRLVDGTGKPVTAQKQVLARWQDGSIRWVLLSFIAAPTVTNYRLQFGAAVRDEATEALAVQQPNHAVAVDTGLFQWNAAPAAGGAYRIGMRQGGKELLGNARLVLTDTNGKTYSSAFAPDAVKIETNGPHHAVVLLSGPLGNGTDKSTFFRYVVRWHFQRNSAAARVQVTLENNRKESTFSEVKSVALLFDLPAATGQVQLANLGSFSTAAGQTLRVAQTYDDRFNAQTPAGGKDGNRFPGWLRWQNGGQHLALAVRNFWQLYPKALQVKGNQLEIGIAPPFESSEYERFKGTVEEYRSVFYLMNGNYKLRLGTSFTTEIVLNASDIDGEQVATLTNTPPMLVAQPVYYRDSKAFGDIGLGDEFPLVQSYNSKTALAFKNFLADHDRQHEYGLLNYGDWWGERGINWGNVEYDTQHAFILQFARTGDTEFLQAAINAAVHNRDVDTVHYAVEPPEAHFSIGGAHYPASAAAVGRVWEHSVGHTGGYFKESPVKGQGFNESIFSSSHTWVEGHYEYYLLTGDKRSLEVANTIADVYDAYATINYDFGNCRVPGWLLILTMGAYDYTGDPFYLNAARIIVDRVVERQAPGGGWVRQLATGHCEHQPHHRGEAGFMVGVLMSGLKSYAETTGDQRAKDAIVGASRFLIKDMWIPERKAFRYTSCPGTTPAPGVNLLICEGLAYAWRQTHDAGLRRITLDAMEVVIENMDGKGKNISMELRSTPRQLFDVVEMLKMRDPLTATVQTTSPGIGEGALVRFKAEAKTLKGKIEKYEWSFGDGTTGEGMESTHEYPDGGDYRATLTVSNTAGDKVTQHIRVSAPPPFLQKIDPATDIVVQAEDFSAQGGGKVDIVERRINAVGKAITKWEQVENHWLEWKFEVPIDVDYSLVLKYATGSPQAHRAVQIDGKYPDDALQKVVFPGTGGFSATDNNWKFWTMLNGDNQPLKLSLTKGVHTLRLTNLGGGMALDFLMLQKTKSP